MSGVLQSKMSESSVCSQTATVLKSLLQLKKEVDNRLKLIVRYEQCLKGTEWAVVEELSRFLSPFQDYRTAAYFSTSPN